MEIDNGLYNDLIGICMTDNSKLPYITTMVSVDSLPNGPYKTTYSAIVDLYNLGVEVDIVSVSNYLLNKNKLKEVGGRSFINDIAMEAFNVPKGRFTKKVVGEINKQTTYKKVITLVEEFKDDVKSTEDLDSTCIDYCSRISNIITGNMEEDKVQTISSGVAEVIQDLKDSRANGCLGVDCGFPSMNYYLGGLQKGKLYILGARPSMGKSALAMNISEAVAKDKNVLFISLEMGRKEYAQRLMFGRAGISIDKVNTGEVTEDDISRVQQQKEYLDKLNLYIETKTPCRVSDIELAMINLQSTKGSCDLVVVDYLQLLTPNSKAGKNRETEVAEMSRGLKSLAVKYNVPIIVLSQLSRALEARDDKRPMLSDLRESGAIEQDADVVMFVYRDEWYHRDDPASRGKGEVLIRKNRGGRNNVDIELCWQPSKVKFTEAMRVM